MGGGNLLAAFVVSFVCRLPCEARNAEVEGADLTTAHNFTFTKSAD